MISHEHKCIFVHIPRCGGTSIEVALHGKNWFNVPGGSQTKHLTASSAKDIYKDYWDKYFKFSFVRNPWDRMVSLAMFGDFYGVSLNSEKIDFSKYLEKFSPIEIDPRSNSKKNNVIPVKDSVYLNILDEELDFIGRFENIDNDFGYICSRLNIQKKNLTNDRDHQFSHLHYSKYYDDETRQIIAKKYAKDIERFGYEFEKEKNTINLSQLTYYVLSCNNPKRKLHAKKEFKSLRLVEVNPIMDIGREKSGATGFSKILDLACQNQNRNKPFQPFAIFEDDVKKYREFPDTIEVPHDADILYIGLSSCGMNSERWCNDVRYKNINKDIIRVYNMLATHGMIIYSLRGLLAIQKCMLEGYFKGITWDIFTAQMQPHLNVYALKVPLVYQYYNIGGNQKDTKIQHDLNGDKPIPDSWINTTNISIKTNHKYDCS